MNKILLSCIAALSISCQSSAVKDLEEYKLSLPRTTFSVSEASPANIIINEQTINELIQKNNGVLIANYNLEASKARYELQRSDYGLKSFLKIVPLRESDKNKGLVDFAVQQDFPFGGNFELSNREVLAEERDNQFVLRFSLPLPFSNKSLQRRLTVIRQLHDLNRANNEYVKQVRNKYREVRDNLYEFNYRSSLVDIQTEFLFKLQAVFSIISAANEEQALKEYKTDFAEAQSEMESRRSKKNNTEISFKSALGVSIDSILDFNEFPQYTEENFESSVENKIVELDPDLNSLASQSLVAKEQLRTSNTGRFPDVYFTGEYGLSFVTSEENWAVGLGIDLNLFDSGKNKALQKEGENILQATNLGIEQRINELLSSSKRELLNISEAKQRYLNSLEIVANAKSSYSGVVELLQEGKTTYSETRRLLETYRDGQDDLNKALRDYLQAKARLDVMKGLFDK